MAQNFEGQYGRDQRVEARVIETFVNHLARGEQDACGIRRQRISTR
ncbi:MAG TPA: hypothetical protein VF292_05035 [Rhodanobacteraceae bacterium]